LSKTTRRKSKEKRKSKKHQNNNKPKGRPMERRKTPGAKILRTLILVKRQCPGRVEKVSLGKWRRRGVPASSGSSLALSTFY